MRQVESWTGCSAGEGVRYIRTRDNIDKYRESYRNSSNNQKLARAVPVRLLQSAAGVGLKNGKFA